MESGADRTSSWQIDKRIPVPMLAAVLLQTLVVVIWGAHLDDRVVFLERTTVTTEQYARVDEKMTSLKDDVGSVKADLQNIKDDIRRLAVRTGK
jgi:hypothetical protein